MAHQSSIEYQELCENGDMKNMMLQNLYDEDEGKCNILGTAVDPTSAPLRRNLMGTRPGLRPMIVIPDSSDGFAPGIVRDRRCSPETTELGSTENNAQFIFQRLAHISFQDESLSKAIREMAEVLTTRRRWFHEQVSQVEESRCKSVAIRNMRALVETWKSELLADNCTIALLADGQALASLNKEDTEDIKDAIACPFATGSEYTTEIWDSAVIHIYIYISYLIEGRRKRSSIGCYSTKNWEPRR